MHGYAAIYVPGTVRDGASLTEGIHQMLTYCRVSSNVGWNMYLWAWPFVLAWATKCVNMLARKSKM